jgi:hypothetical protein
MSLAPLLPTSVAWVNAALGFQSDRAGRHGWGKVRGMPEWSWARGCRGASGAGVLESCPGPRSAGVSHVVIEIELNLKHLGPNFSCNIYTIVGTSYSPTQHAETGKQQQNIPSMPVKLAHAALQPFAKPKLPFDLMPSYVFSLLWLLAP